MWRTNPSTTAIAAHAVLGSHLRLRQLHKHLGCWVCHSHLVENGGTVVGDDHLTVCCCHLLHEMLPQQPMNAVRVRVSDMGQTKYMHKPAACQTATLATDSYVDVD